MDSIDPNDIDSSIDRQHGESDANNRIDQHARPPFFYMVWEVYKYGFSIEIPHDEKQHNYFNEQIIFLNKKVKKCHEYRDRGQKQWQREE